MTKRLLWLFMLAILTVGMAACGGGADDGGGDTGDNGGDGEAPVAMEDPVDPATAGSIGGSVTFEGTPPELAEIQMDGEPDCAEMYSEAPREQSVLVSDDGSLQNVFVYIKDGLGDMEFPVSAEAEVLDQQACRYHPHVLGLQAGQELTVLNSDALLHNIHPRPEVNRPFNESQPTEGMEFTKTFTRPEIGIAVGCDVHDWMTAYINVVPHPYHAVTGENGAFEFTNVPPGTYTIAAWHEVYGEQTAEVTLDASGTATADFTFSEG